MDYSSTEMARLYTTIPLRKIGEFEIFRVPYPSPRDDFYLEVDIAYRRKSLAGIKVINQRGYRATMPVGDCMQDILLDEKRIEVGMREVAEFDPFKWLLNEGPREQDLYRMSVGYRQAGERSFTPFDFWIVKEPRKDFIHRCFLQGDLPIDRDLGGFRIIRDGDSLTLETEWRSYISSLVFPAIISKTERDKWKQVLFSDIDWLSYFGHIFPYSLRAVSQTMSKEC